LILRENNYQCNEGILYYATTRQRVRVAIDEPLIQLTLKTIEDARRLMAEGQIPPPLVDSPKCPRCSLVGICLPGETNRCTPAVDYDARLVQRTLFDIEMPRDAVTVDESASNGQVRRLVSARDDLRPLYLNSQGLSVGK